MGVEWGNKFKVGKILDIGALNLSLSGRLKKFLPGENSMMVIIASAIGLAAGLSGGVVDGALMLLMDGLLSFPAILLGTIPMAYIFGNVRILI